MTLQNWQENWQDGRVYKAIERALWLSAPILMLLLLLSYPSIRAARQQLEADLAADVGAETTEYCDKWGMPAGTDKYSICAQDLAAIRARAEQRFRELTAADLDF